MTTGFTSYQNFHFLVVNTQAMRYRLLLVALVCILPEMLRLNACGCASFTLITTQQLCSMLFKNIHFLVIRNGTIVETWIIFYNLHELDISFVFPSYKSESKWKLPRFIAARMESIRTKEGGETQAMHVGSDIHTCVSQTMCSAEAQGSAEWKYGFRRKSSIRRNKL